jgi:uncharacterized protein
MAPQPRNSATSRKRSRQSGSDPARAWQRMLSGRRLDLLDPSPLDIEIEDIAHGLARVARWNGQTSGPNGFSVAQHSVLVADICTSLAVRQNGHPFSPADRLYALLHDAPEYVIGDMISPFKAALGFDYRQFEDRLACAIHIRYGLGPRPSEPVARIIKAADRISAFFEAVELAGFSIAEARQWFGDPAIELFEPLIPLPSQEAQTGFLEKFRLALAEYDAAR